MSAIGDPGGTLVSVQCAKLDAFLGKVPLRSRVNSFHSMTSSRTPRIQPWMRRRPPGGSTFWKAGSGTRQDGPYRKASTASGSAGAGTSTPSSVMVPAGVSASRGRTPLRPPSW
ncbi:hypothetical protein [Marmoricola sp. OAE513]|uniref:hypothetical protein n=1 Tax=Marmoricola sp. OAE513 TaxID=2817894 RepID=UPI0033989E98